MKDRKHHNLAQDTSDDSSLNTTSPIIHPEINRTEGILHAVFPHTVTVNEIDKDGNCLFAVITAERKMEIKKLGPICQNLLR